MYTLLFEKYTWYFNSTRLLFSEEFRSENQHDLDEISESRFSGRKSLRNFRVKAGSGECVSEISESNLIQGNVSQKFPSQSGFKGMCLRNFRVKVGSGECVSEISESKLIRKCLRNFRVKVGSREWVSEISESKLIRKCLRNFRFKNCFEKLPFVKKQQILPKLSECSKWTAR